MFEVAREMAGLCKLELKGLPVKRWLWSSGLNLRKSMDIIFLGTSILWLPHVPYSHFPDCSALKCSWWTRRRQENSGARMSWFGFGAQEEEDDPTRRKLVIERRPLALSFSPLSSDQ